MIEKFTLVYDILLQKFIDVLRSSSIDNQHFNFLQFEKEFDVGTLTWCMLFNEKRECLAAASVQEGYGPATNSTYVNEIQSLKSGHGYGKKMLLLLKKKYTFIWLCANPEVKNDALLKIYRDPQFNFSEYVVPAKDSIYNVDTHIFGVNGRMPRKIWMDFLLSQYGNEQANPKNKSANSI